MKCPRCGGHGLTYRVDKRKTTGDVRRVYICQGCGQRWSDKPDTNRPCAQATRIVMFRDTIVMRRRRTKHESS